MLLGTLLSVGGCTSLPVIPPKVAPPTPTVPTEPLAAGKTATSSHQAAANSDQSVAVQPSGFVSPAQSKTGPSKTAPSRLPASAERLPAQRLPLVDSVIARGANVADQSRAAGRFEPLWLTP